MAGRFSVEAVFKAVDRITAPVSRMQNRVGKFTRSAERGFHKLNRRINKFGALMKRAALGGALALGLTGAAMANVIDVGADFGRAIGSAAAKFPDQIARGTDEFRALETAAREVGKTTEFTSVQAAAGLNFLAKAGFDAKFSMAALAPIVDFATASEIDFAEAADIASDALGAFGLDSKDAAVRMKGLQRVMDVMSLTANSTNTSVAELFEAMKDGGAIASAAGVSIETFSATMGFLASNGIKASKAGTASKAITLALAGVGNKAAQVFGRLGIKLADSNGNLRDQFDVLDDLRTKLKSVSQIKQVAIIEAIFGKRSISAAAKLLTESGKGVRSFREELDKANGSSQRTARFIRNDVRGSIDGLKSAIEGVKISIFSLNEGPLKEAIDKMTEWVRTNEKAIASGIGNFLLNIAENFDEIVSKAVAFGKFMAGLLAFIVVVKTLTAVMLLLNLAMALNPIGLIVLAVAAAIAAFVALVVWVDDVVAAFDRMPWALRIALAPLELIVRGIKFIKDNIGSVFAAAGRLLGITEGEASSESASVDSPSARSVQSLVAARIEERRTTNSAEVTIRDETGRAEVTKKSSGFARGRGLMLQRSGNF